MRSSNHEGCGVAKEIIEVIRVNEDKMVKCCLHLLYQKNLLKNFKLATKIVFT